MMRVFRWLRRSFLFSQPRDVAADTGDMLTGITNAAHQLATAAARPADTAARSGKAFASVIRRDQPAVEAPTSGGPLSARAAARPAATESSAPGAAERGLRKIVGNQRKLERAMRRAMRGDDFSPQQLLALQMQVQKYSIEVETVSRVVDRVTGAVKQAMQTQI